MRPATLMLEGTEGPVPYTIEHRPRVTRRLHLELDRDGQLLVVVPTGWPNFYTRRLLHKHLDLVHRFLARARQRQLPPLRWTQGAPHLFRGETLTLALTPDSRRRLAIEVHADTLRISGDDLQPERVRTALTAWYRKQALDRFQHRLDRLQAATPWARDRSLELALRRMKRTWGTCSNQGVIRLNTHLVKAPPHLLDYVISHELCHLQEMNHGPAFYALQAALWPSWREDRQALREQGHRYTQE